MKKIISILLITLLAWGCASKEEAPIKEETPVEIKITSPNGAPALSLLKVMNDDNVVLDVVEGPEVLMAEFTEGKKDIIIAPIQLGLKACENMGSYKLMAVLTWGNLHLVSSEKDFVEGELAAFGEAAVPGKVIGYLSDELSAYEISWFNEVSEASAALISGEFKAAILAEPYLTMTRSKFDGEIFEIADIQKLYENKTGFDSYPQAALFVKNESLDIPEVIELLEEVKDSVSLYNSDSAELSKQIDSVDLEALGFKNSELIKKAYARMALNYELAKDKKEEISSFMELFGSKLNESLIVE